MIKIGGEKSNLQSVSSVSSISQQENNSELDIVISKGKHPQVVQQQQSVRKIQPTDIQASLAKYEELTKKNQTKSLKEQAKNKTGSGVHENQRITHPIVPPVNKFKFYDTPTFLVMEDSGLVMMNISFMKYDHPKVLETSTDGESAFKKYVDKITSYRLYNFIILGINMSKGLDGNQVMLKIRQYEREHNLPRTYLIAIFNAVGSQIGGQEFTKDTYIFRGFDEAIEKPLKTNVVNKLLADRKSPPLIYSKPEDFLLQYRFFDRFKLMMSDDTVVQIVNFKEFKLEESVDVEYAKCGQSLLDKYMSAINGGRVHSLIIMNVGQKDLSGKEVIKSIREFEKNNQAQRTYVVGVTSLDPSSGIDVQQLINEGYSQVIDSSYTKETIQKIISKLQLTLKIQKV